MASNLIRLSKVLRQERSDRIGLAMQGGVELWFYDGAAPADPDAPIVTGPTMILLGKITLPSVLETNALPGGVPGWSVAGLDASCIATSAGMVRFARFVRPDGVTAFLDADAGESGTMAAITVTPGTVSLNGILRVQEITIPEG